MIIKLSVLLTFVFFGAHPIADRRKLLSPRSNHTEKKCVHLKFYENVKIYNKIHFFLYKNEALLMNYITYN